LITKFYATYEMFLEAKSNVSVYPVKINLTIGCSRWSTKRDGN